MEKLMYNLNDKVAIVTGGIRGIGRAITISLAESGAKVYALGRNLPAEGEVFSENAEVNSRIFCKRTDISSNESIESVFEEVIKEAGKIDILVNNAGITKDNLIIRMTEADFDAVINTNLKGAFLCSKVAIKSMMRQRSGKIINIGSIVGTIGNAGQSNYAASKAGLTGLTKSLAKEVGSRNITVNLLAPSEEQKKYFIDNIPLKKLAETDDIAKVVVFFASDASNYITGQVLHIDGGLAI
jgi:3-oxoacyl-[acyl-carrier protein] reductase